MTDSQTAQANGHVDDSKLPSSIGRVIEMPLVKDTVNYADSLLKSTSLSAAAYRNAEAIATTVYKKAGEPIQDRLQPQINQLDGLANMTLDYVQGKAPFLFDSNANDLVATARKPADQAYSTAKSYQNSALSTAKSYQDLVSSRLHDTLVRSQQTIGGLQERLGAAAAHVPKNGKEAQDLANNLYENLEKLKDAILKQSGDLPAHISGALHPYVEKLQKGAGEVKAELAKRDVPVHTKAQNIIAITKDITSESLHEAIDVLRSYTYAQRKQLDDATDGKASETVEQTKQTGQQAVETVKEQTAHVAEAVKEKTEPVVEAAQEKGQEAAETAKKSGAEASKKVEENAGPAVETAKEQASEVADKPKEKAQEATETTKKEGKKVANKTKENGQAAADQAERKGEEVKKDAKDAKANKEHVPETTEEFVQEHTPGTVSYAEAVKE